MLADVSKTLQTVSTISSTHSDDVEQSHCKINNSLLIGRLQTFVNLLATVAMKS